MLKYTNKKYFSNLLEKDLYKIIGVNKESNKNDIKKAFYQKAKLYHPDLSGTGK
jgi:DnaJ-class molecular chaperone